MTTNTKTKKGSRYCVFSRDFGGSILEVVSRIPKYFSLVWKQPVQLHSALCVCAPNTAVSNLQQLPGGSRPLRITLGQMYRAANKSVLAADSGICTITATSLWFGENCEHGLPGLSAGLLHTSGLLNQNKVTSAWSPVLSLLPALLFIVR